MTLRQHPTIHCDAEGCTATFIGKTVDRKRQGWTGGGSWDLCPKHAETAMCSECGRSKHSPLKAAK